MILKNKFSSTKIFFGKNQRKKLSSIVKNKSILVVCSKRGKKEINSDKSFTFLNKNKVKWIDNVTSNPTVRYIENINKKFRTRKFDYIIAIGGGSTMDTAKALFLLFSMKKNTKIINLIKNISKIKKKSKCKLIALPTTSGTGSEVTSYSTVWDEKKLKKLSITHNFLYPEISIIDPVLTYKLSIKDTINTALDALNQAFESIWNKNSNRETLAYAVKSISLSIKSLKKINTKFNIDAQAREDLSKASLYAGMCISKTRTSICHSISYPLTLNFGVPHGLACAFTMIAVMRLINKKNKTFFKFLIKSLKLNGYKDLQQQLNVLFKKLEVKSKNKEYIKNKKKLFRLIPEMYTPGRTDNFIYKINNKIIKSLIEQSL